jgi:DNA-binding NarL/FixJ family response regulator
VGQATRGYEQLSDRVNVALPEGTLSICPLTGNAVREYLQDYPVIDMFGECKNGRQAVQAIKENKRDLVFPDIRMPGMDGFEVVGH